MPAGEVELMIEPLLISNGAASFVEVEQSIQKRGARGLCWLLEAPT